jgi:hypothetical protein
MQFWLLAEGADCKDDADSQGCETDDNGNREALKQTFS